MATAPVTYDNFFIVFLEDQASFRSTFRMARDYLMRRGRRSVLAMTFMVFAMLFVLAFPTLASAMTGYTTCTTAFVKDRRDNLVSFSRFYPVIYVIHDGWRLNLTGNYLVPQRDAGSPSRGEAI